MFDGNHRVRRPQNLGGGGGGRSRRAAGGGLARGRRVASASGVTSTAGIVAGTGTSAAAAGATSSASSRLSSITGIPDRKSQLLEQARLQREQRREATRRSGAARNIQRSWRSWTCRASLVSISESVVIENGSNQNSSAPETVSIRGRYEFLVEKLLGSCSSDRRQQQEQQQAAAVLGQVSSLLSLLLSPALLPVLVRRHRKLRSSDASSKAAAASEKEIVLSALVLPFAQVVEKYGISQDQGCAFASGRIVRRSLILLQSLALSSSSSLSSSTSASVAATNLIGLISALLGGTDASMTKLLCNSTSTEESADRRRNPTRGSQRRHPAHRPSDPPP